jgi:hypothetical protein
MWRWIERSVWISVVVCATTAWADASKEATETVQRQLIRHAQMTIEVARGATSSARHRAKPLLLWG